MEERPKERDLANLCVGLVNNISMWKKEVNSAADSFDFDSQDVYRTFYDEFASLVVLIEKYPPESFCDDRKNILIGLRTICENIITLYESNKKFFRGLNRRKLMLDAYRRRHSGFYDCPDFQLEAYLCPITALLSKDDYYKSEFYDEYGFLLNDYHFEIYILSKHFLHSNSKDYKSYDVFKTFIDHSESAPYFSMGLIFDVYSFCNEDYFEETSELEFYLSLNLMNVVSELKTRKQESKKVFYILHKFSALISDKEIRDYWLSKTLNRLNLDDKSYKSKYREVISSNSSETDKKFSEEIDSIFKPYL